MKATLSKALEIAFFAAVAIILGGVIHLLIRLSFIAWKSEPIACLLMAIAVGGHIAANRLKKSQTLHREDAHAKAVRLGSLANSIQKDPSKN